MSDLHFRIILVSQEYLDPNEKGVLLSKVKSAVEMSGLSVASINFFQVKKSEDEQFSEIEELSFEIVAKNKSDFRPKDIQYNEFSVKWERNSRTLPCSYLEFYDKEYFTDPDLSHHVTGYQRIEFGVLPHNGFFYRYSHLDWNIDDAIKFYHDTRSVEINLEINGIFFQMIFSYENIRNIFVQIESNPRKIYFDLCNPPIIFRMHVNSDTFKETKHRNSNLSGAIDTDILGRSNVLCVVTEVSDKIQEILSSIHYVCSEKSIYFTSVSSVSKSKPHDPCIERMHFSCTYLITALLRRNFVLSSQAQYINYAIGRLRLLSERNPEALEKALTSVLAALDSGKILNYWHAIDNLYTYYNQNKDEINFKAYTMPDKCCMIRRVVLTPTRQLLWPKEIMLGNRVLRNFDSEYSLRVSFREENFSSLSFNASHADPGVLEACIKDPMTNGICIGPRKYEFLAWSNSQIRDHGVWMYATYEMGKTAASIRQWMGDFSHIHNVSKYMARMGQCFSQTEDALSVPLDSRFVRTENDIEGGFDAVNGKPYCFSDGIGRISTDLAEEVRTALGHDKKCSAFQIRYGGYKGLLVVDPTLRDTKIVFRKSMKKFDCPNSTRLEIARTSKPSRLQLNRPFITLLNGHGVRHRTFLRLQEEMLKTLTDMLFDETEAAKYLNSKTPSDLFDFEALSHSGIYLTTEPFFKSILLALHRHSIDKIKTKANVAIDPSKGRNMLGVLDETASLQYGQVFVQYTKDILCGETNNETVILQGVVLVTKNPCLHPGDVRKYQAVNIPQLHHIVDCIVFPQNGHRPHPNEMAGSDLDGDEYSVLWSRELIFNRSNYPPGDFPVISAPDVSQIQVSHMIDFLQDYIKNDQVGIIANAHLAQADRFGIDSDICLSIAKKFSIAVDFAKNGRTEVLALDEYPYKSPDFMEKKRGLVYESEKALGKMYRESKDFESENQETSINYKDIKVDPDLLYEGWELYRSVAIEARQKYNALFSSVLRNYGVQHEAEVFSGAFTNLHCRFHERKDRHEIEKVIVSCMKKLCKRMFAEFMEEFQNSGSVGAVEQRMLQKASAWYAVTYSDPNAKFLSFPWSVSKFLVNIKLRKTMGRQSSFSPIILRLDRRIVECESKNLLPYITSTGIWHEYDIICDSQVLKRALQALILWARDEEVLERPGESAGLLYESVFIKLFFHVAEKFGYVKRKYTSNTSFKSHFSSGQLSIEFLKFCSMLRFYNEFEMHEMLPFTVYRYGDLARRAITSYHNFALSGSLENLNFDTEIEEQLYVMKSIHLKSDIFSRGYISACTLREAERILMKFSKVHQISLRAIRQTRRVCVSARGSGPALKKLKDILSEDYDLLREFLVTGVMPKKQDFSAIPVI